MEKIYRTICLYALLICFVQVAPAQSNVYTINVVGYVNTTFHAGDNLFGNPLESSNNALSSLFPSAPEGSTVSLWNSIGNTFNPVATFVAGAWDIDFVLDPGTGAKLHATSLFTNTFVGTVLAPDGTVWGGGPLNPPAPFAGPNGVHLLSGKTPIALTSVGNPVFEYTLGRGPNEGEQFTTLDPLTQQYHTTTFISGAWNNGEPSLGVGVAGFFNVGPVAAVPEPSAVSLALAGLCVVRLISRRR